MEFIIEMADDLVVLHPEGSLVASETDSLRSEVESLINNNHRYLLLNMSKIDFMDSSGLGSIIAINKLIKNSGGIFVCADLKVGVRTVFRVTRADQKVTVTATESEAADLIRERKLH